MKNLLYPKIILTFALLILPLLGWAQAVKPVTLFKYTQNDGLSSSYITKIITDSNGFMWVGTQEGLNLFDGKQFHVFSKQAAPHHRLGGSFVSDMVEDKKRNLIWILTSYGDICAININTRTIVHRLTLDQADKPLAKKWMRCLQLQGNTLWIGGLNAISAYDIASNKYLKIDLVKKSNIGSGEFNISKIIVDNEQRLWLCSEGYGVIVLDKYHNVLKCFKQELINGVKQNRKLLFWEALIQHDTVYVATSWGLRMFNINGKTITQLPLKTPDILTKTEIQTMTFGPGNLLLFSTPEKFYTYDFTSKKLEQYQDEDKEGDGLSLSFQLFYDSHSQKVWVGTQAGLVSFSLRAGPFSVFSRSSQRKDKIKHLYAILPTSDNEVYGGGENGLFYINSLTKEIQLIDTASSNYLLFKDIHANIFVSNKNGFQIIKDKKIRAAHERFPALRNLEKDHLSCAIQYNDSIVLFSSVIQKGLSLWNTKSRQVITFHKDSLKNRIEDLSIINFLYKGMGNEIFILTEKSIITFNPLTYKYETKKIESTTSDTIINNFMDMCETHHSYWIATYGHGLIETDKNFKVKKIFTVESGLSNNCIYRVFSYQKHLIVVSTNNGLSALDIQQNKIKNYFQTDGLHGNGFEQLCGYQDSKNIYMGGINGFTIINPSRFYANPNAPSLFLTDIKIETSTGVIDTCNLKLDQLIIPNNVLQATINFSGLNYLNPSRVEYAYKIDELSEGWINLGYQSFVNLIGLNPGTYTLQVKSSNEDGIWNAYPIKLKLVFQPKWFQTAWFKIIVLMIGLTLLYVLYRFRIIQINKQQQIRKEIANNLHDDIGSTLNTLKIFTHLAKKEPENKEHVNQIEESITDATLGLRDIIWVLDDSEDTLFELTERIKKFALPVCLAHNILFVINFDIDKPISKTEKRNLLLIAKESINNSIKYSACKKIQVTISPLKNIIKFRIEDDGIGFDVDKVYSGRGLSSIRYRANQISYHLNIASSGTRGTIVELTKLDR